MACFRACVAGMGACSSASVRSSLAAVARTAASSFPFLENLRKKGLEVTYITDPVDEYAVPQLEEFGGKKFKSTTMEGLGIEDEDEKKEVGVSGRVAVSPCVLTTSECGWSANRYYGGDEVIDMAENLRKTRALQAFCLKDFFSPSPPFLEFLRMKGLEVVYVTDPADGFAGQQLLERDGMKLKSATMSANFAVYTALLPPPHCHVSRGPPYEGVSVLDSLKAIDLPVVMGAFAEGSALRAAVAAHHRAFGSFVAANGVVAQPAAPPYEGAPVTVSLIAPCSLVAIGAKAAGCALLAAAAARDRAIGSIVANGGASLADCTAVMQPWAVSSTPCPTPWA